MSRNRTRIGTFVLGDTHRDGDIVHGPSIDGQLVPDGDIVIRDGRIAVDSQPADQPRDGR